MNYIYQPGKQGHAPLILFHGTGGNEQQMLPIGNYLNSEASLVSVRGQVSENGLNRYFKRLEEGIYDLEDLHFRGQELLNGLNQFGQDQELDLSQAVLVGFSNGANIAINLLLHPASPFQSGILFAPMYPVPIDQTRNLENTKVFLSMGTQDPICNVEASQQVISLFKDRQAEVTEYWGLGHEISVEALNQAKDWLINSTPN